MSDVSRYETIELVNGKGMRPIANGRYVHYNDWKRERAEVNKLRLELIRVYLLLEGVVNVECVDGSATVVLSLDK